MEMGFIYDLEGFVHRFQSALEKNMALPELIEQGRKLLSQLVSSSLWLQGTLARLVLDEEFLRQQWHSIDPNDILLYRAPDGLFSVRAFVWEPGVNYPIHDHGAWGIVGACINRIRERKYQRLDDGSREGYAEVGLKADAALSPSETTYVLPLDEGIHQMEALDGKTAVTIHVYGRPVRKGFIQFFDPVNRRVQKMYPPQVLKKILAIRTLGSVEDSWAEEVLQEAARMTQPEYLQAEIKSALSRRV